MNTENEMILKQAELAYKVRLVDENTMGKSGNKVFEVSREQSRYILRASAYSPEKERHTAFELEWMAYLSNSLTGIVRPQKSEKGNLYEVADIADKAYILCLLEKAPGKVADADDPNVFNEKLFFDLGALMGDMHRLTVGYAGNIRKPEFEWTGSVNLWRYENIILDEQVRRRQKKYYDEISALPIDKEHYGIIHWDIHTDNFFVDHGSIKLFDFDACQLNWFAADMASAIFFMVLKGAGPLTHKSEKERTAFAEAYVISYLKGYLQTYTTSAYWIRKMELFMKYQMCDEYLAGQSFWPEELAHLQDWYLNWHKEKIVSGSPYVCIDYEKVINSIPKCGD